MDAQKDPPTALKMRQQYDFKMERGIQSNTGSSSNSVEREHGGYDEDRDLRTPCVPHSPPEPAVDEDPTAGSVSGWRSDASSLGSSQFREEPKANRQLRVRFAILIHLLSTLLASLRVVVCRRLAEERVEYRRRRRLWMKRVDGFTGADPRLLLLKTSDSRLKFTTETLKRPLDLNDDSKNETSDCRLEFTEEKQSGFPGFEIDDCHPRFTKEKRNWFLGLLDQLLPASVSWVVCPVRGQHPTGGSGSGGEGPDPRPQLTPEGLTSAETQWPPDSMHGTLWTTFRQELYRLGTFLDLPQDFPVSPLRLAQAGFLRLADGSIVCYFCGLVRNEWRDRQSPLQVHQELRPDCPMVTGGDCQNIAVADVTPEDRLADVLQSWSLSPGGGIAQSGGPPRPSARTDNASGGADVAEDGTRASLEAGAQASGFTAAAAAGTARANVVGPAPQRVPPIRMGLMGGAPSSADPAVGRSPIFPGTAQPQRQFQAPPRAPNRDGPSQLSEDRRIVTYQQLGIITGTAKRPDMVTLQSRLDTFHGNWVNHVHSPGQLAEAGFYYAGYADCGRCFFCGGGLKNWEASDDPWVAHARWFPTCAYVRQSQGQEFINIVRDLNAGNNDRPISMAQVKEELFRRSVIDPQEVSIDPAVGSAVAVGFSQQAAQAAALRMVREGQSLSVISLMDCLETDGVQPTASAAEANDSSLPGEVQRQSETFQTENAELRQLGRCKICLDNEASIIFLPCGHLVTCSSCSPALRNCPLCRLNIKGRVRAFRPA